MKTPVVITALEYGKGKEAFDEAADRYEWVVSSPDEASVASLIEKSGARTAVLGVDKYEGPLYAALEKNAAGKPALIARYGVGYDSVNLDECKKRGIFLSITPGALDLSVAEHTLALILGFAKNIAFCDAEMRAGRFTPKAGFELTGKKLALAGFGNIGRQVCRMASFGFGMMVSAFDVVPLKALAEKEGLDTAEYRERYGLSSYSNDFQEAAADADILSTHMPVLPATLKFMNASRFSVLKKGVLFVNTSRGRLVDEADLYNALQSGHLGGAALDVFEKEPYVPVSPDKDLRTCGNVVLSSHVAANTREANAKMRSIVIRNVDAFLAGEFEKMTTVKLG